ncbi:hypothetical protein ACQEU8_20380 [Streptomyces sp. CA-250714]|uniref:hypothetical protein n=1 Tax=Streptomyces sp. CA-250714 TaxID=3240060 RepID=UPI003D9222EE
MLSAAVSAALVMLVAGCSEDSGPQVQLKGHNACDLLTKEELATIGGIMEVVQDAQEGATSMCSWDAPGPASHASVVVTLVTDRDNGWIQDKSCDQPIGGLTSTCKGSNITVSSGDDKGWITVTALNTKKSPRAIARTVVANLKADQG